MILTIGTLMGTSMGTVIESTIRTVMDTKRHAQPASSGDDSDAHDGDRATRVTV